MNDVLLYFPNILLFRVRIELTESLNVISNIDFATSLSRISNHTYACRNVRVKDVFMIPEWERIYV